MLFMAWLFDLKIFFSCASRVSRATPIALFRPSRHRPGREATAGPKPGSCGGSAHETREARENRAQDGGGEIRRFEDTSWRGRMTRNSHPPAARFCTLIEPWWA